MQQAAAIPSDLDGPHHDNRLQCVSRCFPISTPLLKCEVLVVLLVIRTYGLCFCNRQILHRLLAILGVVCVVGAVRCFRSCVCAGFLAEAAQVLVITGQAISPMTPGGDVNDTCGFQLGGKSCVSVSPRDRSLRISDGVLVSDATVSKPRSTPRNTPSQVPLQFLQQGGASSPCSTLSYFGSPYVRRFTFVRCRR